MIPLAESNPLISISLGVMIWTLIAFLVTLFVLNKARVPADRRGAGPPPEGDRRVDRLGAADQAGGG